MAFEKHDNTPRQGAGQEQRQGQRQGHTQEQSQHDDHANRDPISAAPGSHPVGAASGVASTGSAGKTVGGKIDPTVEDVYWEQHFHNRPYVEATASYEDYGPAYRYGVDNFDEGTDTNFDEVETRLAQEWESERGRSTLNWDNARHAVRDSWDRLGSER